VRWPDDIPVAPFRPHCSPDAFAALLAGAGFTGVTARLLSWEHRVDPRQWREEVYLARVGTNGVVIGRQDAATVARIRDTSLGQGHGSVRGPVALARRAARAVAWPVPVSGPASVTAGSPAGWRPRPGSGGGFRCAAR